MAPTHDMRMAMLHRLGAVRVLQTLPPREIDHPCGGVHEIVFVQWLRCDGWRASGNTCRSSARIRYACKVPR